MNEGVLHNLSTLVITSLVDNSHSNSSEVVSYCSFFLCISLIASEVEYLFLYLLAILYGFLGEVLVQGLCPFFNWISCLFGV